MKYIDAEKLLFKIKGLQCEQGFDTGEAERAYQSAIKDTLVIITSLQQEMELPDKYQTPDWIWRKVTIDQLAEEDGATPKIYLVDQEHCVHDYEFVGIVHTAAGIFLRLLRCTKCGHQRVTGL